MSIGFLIYDDFRSHFKNNSHASSLFKAVAHEIIVRAIQLGGPAEEKGGDWKVEKVVSLIAKTESARLQHRNPFGYQDIERMDGKKKRF